MRFESESVRRVVRIENVKQPGLVHLGKRFLNSPRELLLSICSSPRGIFERFRESLAVQRVL